jgi:hypothetical protein
VEAEPVHQGQFPPARPVPRAERCEEPDGGGGHVATGERTVVPPRREADADNREIRVDCLERVVARREERPERPRRALLRTRELRAPEGGLVGLVADHELPDLGVSPGQLREPCAESLRACEAALDLAGWVWIRCEDDAQAGPAGGGDRQIQKRSLTERERVARLPADSDDRLTQTERGHLVVEGSAGVGLVLARVVVRAHVRAPRGTRADERAHHRDRE